MERSVRQLIMELAQVEDEIRRLTTHSRTGAVSGGLGMGGLASSGCLGGSDTELRELHLRETELVRALRSVGAAHKSK
jgi:hypothetical protein